MALRGETIGTAFVRILADGSGLDESIRRQMEDSEPTVAAGARDHADVYQDTFAERTDRNDKMSLSLEKKLHEAFAVMRADADAAGGDLGDRLRQQIFDHLRLTGGDKNELRAIARGMTDDLLEGFARTGELGDFRAAFTRTVDSINKDTGRLDQNEPALRRFGNRIDRIGDIISKGFGRGARNNFFNLTGVITKGAFSIAAALPKGVSALSTFVSGLSGLKKQGDNLSTFGESFSGIGSALAKGLSTGIPALIALAGAMQLVIFTSGFLVSGISAIIGILAALASSIAFGIVGALAPLAGLIAPIGAAIGGVALAFVGLDKATKKDIAKNLKPIKDAFQDIGDEVRTGLFSNLGQQANRLRQLFDTKPVRTFARNVGKAISGIGDSFLDVLESRGFRQFSKRMGTAIPSQISKLGDIFADAFGAMSGIMRALVPSTNRFLKWIGDIVDKFSKWVNTRDGQKAIRDFLDRAADSAQSVGHFLESVWNFIWKILNAGKESGDTIFDKMAGSIQKAADFLSSEKGQKALEQWFKDAEKTALKIGDMVRALVKFLDKLDTPKNRKMVRDFFDGITKTINWISEHWGAVKFFEKWISPIGQIVLAFKVVRWTVHKIKDALDFVWDKFRKAYKWIKDKLEDLRDKFNKVKEKVEELGRTIRDAPAKAFKYLRDKATDALSWVRDKFNDVREKVGDVESRIKSAFGDAFAWVRGKASDFGTFIRGKVSDIVGFFRDLPDRVANAASGLAQTGRDLMGDFLDGIVNAANNAAGFVSDIGSAIAHAVIDAINTLLDLPLTAHIDPPGPLGPWDFTVIPRLASGGIVTGPTVGLLGESGREAVVPLDRPLSMVDPAVRQLALMSKSMIGPASNSLDRSRTVDVGGITIVTPTEDPAAVAQETINRLVASTYF